MTINHIGTRAMSLYITKAELCTLRLTPDIIGREEAMGLLKLALRENRLDGWEAAELEVYPGKDSILLFARRKSGAPKHFFFASFETLLQAAHLAPDMLPSSLARTQGGYVLTVYPFEGEPPPAVLYEYGETTAGAACLPAHWAEQGQMLIAGSAIACLRMHFAVQQGA